MLASPLHPQSVYTPRHNRTIDRYQQGTLPRRGTCTHAACLERCSPPCAPIKNSALRGGKQGRKRKKGKRKRRRGEVGRRAEREHVPWFGGVLVLSAFLSLLLLGHVAPLGPNLVHILLRAPPARHRAETARTQLKTSGNKPSAILYHGSVRLVLVLVLFTVSVLSVLAYMYSSTSGRIFFFRRLIHLSRLAGTQYVYACTYVRMLAL